VRSGGTTRDKERDKTTPSGHEVRDSTGVAVDENGTILK